MSATNLTMLIIDDDPDVRNLLAAFGRAEGFETMEAEDGVLGWALAVDTRPAVIFCDERMPRMGGRETLEALKNEPATTEIPVVIMGGMALSEEEWKARGAMTTLQKPFAGDELILLLRSAFEQRSAVAAGNAA